MKRIILFIILALLMMYPLTIISFHHPKVALVREGIERMHRLQQQMIRLLRVPDTSYIYIEWAEEGDSMIYEDTLRQVLTNKQKLRLWKKSRQKFLKMQIIMDSMAVIYEVE